MQALQIQLDADPEALKAQVKAQAKEIEKLRQECADKDVQIAQLRQNSSSLSATVAARDKRIAAQNTRVAILEAKAKNLQTDLVKAKHDRNASSAAASSWTTNSRDSARNPPAVGAAAHASEPTHSDPSAPGGHPQSSSQRLASTLDLPAGHHPFLQSTTFPDPVPATLRRQTSTGGLVHKVTGEIICTLREGHRPGHYHTDCYINHGILPILYHPRKDFIGKYEDISKQISTSKTTGTSIKLDPKEAPIYVVPKGYNLRGALQDRKLTWDQVKEELQRLHRIRTRPILQPRPL